MQKLPGNLSHLGTDGSVWILPKYGHPELFPLWKVSFSFHLVVLWLEHVCIVRWIYKLDCSKWQAVVEIDHGLVVLLHLFLVNLPSAFSLVPSTFQQSEGGDCHLSPRQTLKRHIEVPCCKRRNKHSDQQQMRNQISNRIVAVHWIFGLTCTKWPTWNRRNNHLPWPFREVRWLSGDSYRCTFLSDWSGSGVPWLVVGYSHANGSCTV